MENKSQQLISFRLNEDVAKELRHIAVDRSTSISSLLSKIVEEWIKDYAA